MTDLTPDHPAVEAAAQQLSVDESSGRRFPPSQRLYETATGALNVALPHLDAATPENLARLRDTPVGQLLKAEGWHEGAMAEADAMNRLTPGARRIMEIMVRSANPYPKDDA